MFSDSVTAVVHVSKISCGFFLGLQLEVEMEGSKAYLQRELRKRQTDTEVSVSSLLCVSALPPSPRDVLLQTLSPNALRRLWPNPTCKQLQ